MKTDEFIKCTTFNSLLSLTARLQQYIIINNNTINNNNYAHTHEK